MSHAPLSPEQTARALPYGPLADEIAAVLRDRSVQVPARIVQHLEGGGRLLVMPAADARVAITKLVTVTPANAGTALPTIQGDVVVFDGPTGSRRLILDGPTVTARRTAAVSLLAARQLAPRPDGRLLIVGAGVQGKSHLEAFAEGLGVREVSVCSRNPQSAQALVEHAIRRGLSARRVDDPARALADCALVVTATPANAVVLDRLARQDVFIAAVGAFTPSMMELSPELCRELAANGTVIVDTRDADHEAGDLLQAGLDVGAIRSLADVLMAESSRPSGPVLFKSCGWGGWDLAAARLAARAVA